MTQRKTYSRTSSAKGRTTSDRKPPQKKYNHPPKKSNSRPPKNSPHKKGGNIIWVLLALILIAAGTFIGLKINSFYNDNTICKGITIDDVDISGMTYDNALIALTQHNQQKLDSISINLHYEDKSWNFDATKLKAKMNIEEVLDNVTTLGHEGSLSERMKAQKEIRTQGRGFKTSLDIDESVLINALDEIKSSIDNPMIEGRIEFDPSNYDFFADEKDPTVDMSRSMFKIIPGKVGYSIDYEGTKKKIDEALQSGYHADITITAEQTNPTFTEQELQECTTLIYHSSSQISSTNSKDANRNHNIAKAIKFYKGLVVMPGDFISYNELLGERTQKAGWLEANTIAQDKSYKKALGGGICQAATTIFNAAFRAGATITENHPHSFRAYKSFGLAMDAMINWASGDDMAFKNDTKYPIFFNTYFWYSPSSGLPKYVDVDVYTMPQKDEQGNILHIMPDSQEIENQPPAQPPEYIEDTENQFADKKWSYDAKLNKEIYKHVKTSNLFKYNVDKVWYKDCVEQKMGVWTGGTEVKREHSHTYTYKSVRGKIYTRSVAPAAPQQPATATGGASG